jgi:hypothetical protein
MRDRIVDELAKETTTRLQQWRAERMQLLSAQTRIAELDEMIAGAEAELEALHTRKPELRPVREGAPNGRDQPSNRAASGEG